MSEIPEELREEVYKWRNLKRERPAEIVIPASWQESVWDYPRPPRVEPTSRHLWVEFAGVVIAESRRAYRVLETANPPVYYLPPDDVGEQYLIKSMQTALCEWKGVSRYWSVAVGDRMAENAAWSYPDPWQEYELIRNHIAFNASKMDGCFVDGIRVTPQPGNYYGGWITPDIAGPFKGGPGTRRW